MVVIEFDPSKIDDGDDDFGPVPAGEYLVVLSNSDGPIETSNGKGRYIKLEFQIVEEGKYHNRRIFENLNLWRYGDSENDRLTEKIARRKFKSLCDAVGVPSPRDTQELHDIPFILRVKIENDDEFGPRNRVVGYKPHRPNQMGRTDQKFTTPW